ncbi:H-NS histone family protein [Aquisalimonas sp. 2447]|uniref:H-NS histone family protein n=1 Tax=Aquisalimonas sp. 2447 TaxID=2740807 RepID=UPI0014326D20|nr:H-NS histone family protein [Aquisalimonas sp. 2447]QIT55130.1 H-NS histone family protein [Aquisalimonas sp. 2447]
MDLTKHSTPELNQLKKDIDKELKKRRRQDVKEAQKELKQVAEKYGLAVTELVPGGATKSGAKAGVVRFRHPEDPAKGWSGRGRKPAWIKEWEAKGRSLEDLRVD